MLEMDFKTETRAGVEHFVSGQHRAVVIEPAGIGVLMYCDVMGWAVVMPVERADGEWRTARMALRVTVTGLSTGWTDLRADFELSQKMLDAIAAAEILKDDEKDDEIAGLVSDVFSGEVVVKCRPS